MTDSPHDKLFKEAFGDVENAAGLIRSMVPPALVEHIDFTSLTPVPADFRDVALRDSQSDRWVDLLRSLQCVESGRDALLVLFRYVSMVADQLGLQRFQQVVHQVLPEVEDSLMTIAEEMRQLGLKQGLQQGLKQGLQQGLQSQRALLMELLRIKFGNVDEHVVQLLDAADEPALKRYATRILSAATLTEVFARED